MKNKRYISNNIIKNGDAFAPNIENVIAFANQHANAIENHCRMTV